MRLGIAGLDLSRGTIQHHHTGRGRSLAVLDGRGSQAPHNLSLVTRIPMRACILHGDQTLLHASKVLTIRGHLLYTQDKTRGYTVGLTDGLDSSMG